LNGRGRFFERIVRACSQATLAILDKLDIDSEKPNEEEVARMFGYEEEYLAGTLTRWQRTKPRLWALFNEPHSSLLAKVSGAVFAHVLSRFYEAGQYGHEP